MDNCHGVFISQLDVVIYELENKRKTISMVDEAPTFH